MPTSPLSVVIQHLLADLRPDGAGRATPTPPADLAAARPPAYPPLIARDSRELPMALDSELSELVRLLLEGTRAGKLPDWRHGHDDDVFRLPLRVGTALSHSHHVVLHRLGSEEPGYSIALL